MPFRMVALCLAAALSVGTFAFLITRPMEAPGESGSWCMRAERDDYPRLEDAAKQVLGDLGDRTTLLSECEERGQPRGSVEVSVYDCAGSKPVRKYLRGAGLKPVSGSGGRFQPGDGAYEVGYWVDQLENENDGRRFVSVRFMLPR
jgi:hypothetical protein